jgi:hypothetical protein
MLLAVVPACSIRLLSGRLLVFAGLGAMGLMAQFMAGFIERSDWTAHRPAWRVPAAAACYTLIALHAVLPPLLIPIMAAIPNNLQTTITQVTDIGPLPGAERQDVVILNAPSPFHFIYMPGLRDLRGEPIPAHTRILAEGYASVDVVRVDDRTLMVRPERGYQMRPGTGVYDGQAAPAVHLVYMYQHLGTFFRSPSRQIQPGRQIALTGMRTEVATLTADGRPWEVRVRFDRPLEDSSFEWLWWDWETGAYEVFTPPPVGSTASIPGPRSSLALW